MLESPNWTRKRKSTVWKVEVGTRTKRTCHSHAEKSHAYTYHKRKVARWKGKKVIGSIVLVYPKMESYILNFKVYINFELAAF